MGQQPNIELEAADLPREGTERAAERRWRPSRPGEISSPADVPSSAAFGRPGPDTGWALHLIRRADYDGGTRHREIEPVLTAVVGARAAHFGRAPIPHDVEVGLTLLGLRDDEMYSDTLERLAAARNRWLDAAAHEVSKGATAIGQIPEELLSATADRIREQLNTHPDLLD